MQRRMLCALPLALAAGGARASSGTLRFALGQSWGPPFIERQGSRLLGGLLPDLMTAIAAEMGLQPEFVVLPSARIDAALLDGTVDLQCLYSPSWWPDPPPGLRWSEALLTLRDVLVASASGPADAAAFASGLKAGRRWTLATVRGYHYPRLDADLKAGRLQRMDALDQWSVLQMLARQRTELGVVKSIALQTYRSRHPKARLRELQVVEEVQGHCLIGARPAVPAERIQAAIRRLLAKDGVAAVLQPYR